MAPWMFSRSRLRSQNGRHSSTLLRSINSAWDDDMITPYSAASSAFDRRAVVIHAASVAPLNGLTCRQARRKFRRPDTMAENVGSAALLGVSADRAPAARPRSSETSTLLSRGASLAWTHTAL